MKCLAIYDWETDFGMDSAYYVLNECLNKIQLGVNNLKVIFQGWPRAKKISNSELAILLKQTDKIKSVEGELGFLSGGNHSTGSFLVSSMPKMLFVGLPDSAERIFYLECLAKSFAEKTRLGYGYAFESDDGDEAALYASGVTYVKAGESVDPKSSEADERWFNELILGKEGRKRYRDDGMMRNVYCLNILNAHHLEREVDNANFSSFIRRKGLGHIEKIGIDNWLWRVDGENRSKARNYLRSVLI